MLLGEAEFLYDSDSGLETCSIEDVPSLFDPNDSEMKIWNFAKTDLDGDGKDEVVCFAVGVSGDMGGHMVFHADGDKVYGYSTDSRTMVDLKTDGTFTYSDPTGMNESGIASITSFSEEGYEMDKISYATGSYMGWESFVVDKEDATEQEFLDVTSQQGEKQNVEWLDFTDENIQGAFGE